MNNFSIVIPLFNKEKEIKDTLESVLKQSYQNFEIIIVDDGSNDKSAEIVKSFKDNRIIVFHKKNEGVSIARNFGVRKAKNNLIAFLDADDFWHTNHLENLNRVIGKFPNHQWYASAYEKRRTQKLITKMESPILEKGENWSGEVQKIFKYCFKDSLVNSSTVCFKKEFFTKLKGFNIDYTHGEDTDLWIRAAINAPIIFSNVVTARHNLISDNRSITTPINQRKTINLFNYKEDEKKIPSLKKYLDLNRYSQLIKMKLSGLEQKDVTQYINSIDLNNLNNKQRYLIKQPPLILRLFFSFQKLLEKFGIRLSSF